MFWLLLLLHFTCVLCAFWVIRRCSIKVSHGLRFLLLCIAPLQEAIIMMA